MDLGFGGKKVLITGASQGIGAATARIMGAEGADLILVARNIERLEETRRSILETSDVSVQIASHDLSRVEEIDRLAEQHPAIDVLVNNAGAVPGGSLFDVSDERWRAGWDSKVFAYIHMCRRYYPLMQSRGGGVIVNVIGTGSLRKEPAYLCGGMANAALDFLTQTLGGSSHKDGIRVVGIAPGPTHTERFRKITAARGLDPANMADKPFGRLAHPEEIGNLIAFAASGRSSYMSGTIIVVDGGASVGKYPNEASIPKAKDGTPKLCIGDTS